VIPLQFEVWAFSGAARVLAGYGPWASWTWGGRGAALPLSRFLLPSRFEVLHDDLLPSLHSPGKGKRASCPSVLCSLFPGTHQVESEGPGSKPGPSSRTLSL
jgi:hypothetical protein